MKHQVISGCLAAALAVTTVTALANDGDRARDDRSVRTATPIKHFAVIFQENISYDHYFGTYPNAMNLPGETPFHAKPHTPRNNNLVTPLDVNNQFVPLSGVDLLNNNPNKNNPANGAGAVNPFRL